MKLKSPRSFLGKIISALMIVLTVLSASSLSAALALPGDLDTTFNYGAGTRGTNGTVYAAAVQSDGKVIIGGSFNQYNGSAVPTSLIRLNTDGTLDTTFNNGGAGIGGGTSTVRALAIDSGGNVIVGGNFTSYNGAVVPTGLIRLTNTGALDATFNNGGSGVGGGWTSSMVYSVAIRPSDGKVVVGGDFTSYNGDSSIPNLVMLVNTDGTPDTTFNYSAGSGILNTFYPVPGLCGAPVVYSLALDSNERIVVGGNCFNAHNSAGVTDVLGSDNFQRLNANGTLDTTFNYGPPAAALDGFDSTVFVVAVQSDNNVIVGGTFTTYNHDTNIPDGILRVNSSDGLVDTSFTYGAGTGIVNTINANPEAVLSLAIQTDGKVIVGGDWFNAFNEDGITNDTNAADNLLRLNTDGTVDTTFSYGPTRGSNAAVRALAINPSAATPYNTRIWVGGSFTSYSGDANAPDGIERLSFEGVTTTTITSDNPDPSVYGQTVTVTFTVVSPSGTPTGNVTVTDGVDSCVGTVAAGSCDITLTTLGSRTLTATYAGDSNFAGSVSTGVSHQVDPAPLTPSITASDKVYDGNTTASFTCSLSGVVGSDDVSCSDGTASFADPNVNTNILVTATGLSLSGTDAGNYTLSSTSATDTADITAVSLTPSITASDKVYDGNTTASFTCSLSGVIGSDDVSCSGGTASFADPNVGTNILVTATGLSLSGTDAGNYTLSSTSATDTADITAVSLTPSITANDKVYDGNTTASFTCSLSGVVGSDDVSCSGGTASFADPNVNTNILVTATGLSLSGTDAGNYTLSSTSATDTADITAVSLTPSITASDKVYDGNTTASFTCSLSGVIGSDDVSCSGGAASFADPNVNTNILVTATGLSLSGTDAGNYSLSSTSATDTADITAVSLTPSITANDKVYDGNTTASFTCSLSGVIGSDDVSCSGGTASFADPNVGTNILVTATGLSLSGTDAGNYALSSTSDTDTADITAVSLTPSITASDKVYDGNTTASFTCSLSGVIGSDDVSCSGGTASFADPNVGTNILVTATGLSLSGTDAGNYALSSTSDTDTADITAVSLTPSITANDKVYDGNTTASFTCSLSGVIGSDDVSCSGGTASFADPNVNTNILVTATGLSLSGTDAGNYSLSSTSATDTADITTRALNVTATGINKVYDGNTTASVSLNDDRIGGDALTVSYTSASFADPDVGTNKPVSVSGISLSGADAGNYTLGNTTASTIADITSSLVTPSITANDKVYDGNTTASFTCSLSGVIGSDDVSCSGGTASFADPNVNTNILVTATGLSLSGTDAGNYSLSSTSATDNTADITTRALNVTATGINKVYDGNTTASVSLNDDRIGGDALTVSYTSASFADPDVGTNKPVSVSGISLSGADAGNYTLGNTTTSTTANITARTLNVTATGINKVYDGNTTATVSLNDDRIGGDVLTVSYTSASFADPDVGTNKPVSVSGISLSGVDAGNYTLGNTTTSATADITAVSLTPSITANDKVYDGNTTASFTCSLSGVIGSDDVSCSGGTASFADPNVNTNILVTATGLSLSGADAGNYTLGNTTTSTTADITARTLNVTATGIDKVYDGNTTATVTLNDDRIGGDALTVSYTSASFADPDVGTNKPVSVSGISLSGADAGNYTLGNTTTSTTADITLASLTITANDDSKTYDGNPYSGGNGVTYSGFVGSDNETNALGGTLTYSGTSQGAVNQGAYIITPGGLTASNYNITFNDGTLTISASTPGITWNNPADVVYGTPLSGTQLNATSPVAGTFTYTPPSGTVLNVGNNQNLHVDFVPSDAINYSNASADVSINVTKATLTVIADNQNINFGDPDPAFTFTYSGFVPGDSATDIDTPPTCTVTGPHTNAGTYPIVCSGATDDNYTFSYVNGTLSVGLASQTITITTPAPTDAAPGSSFVVAATSSSGLPVSYSASGACTNVGATFTMSAVGSGTCTVLYDQAGNANYAPAPQLTETVNGILVIVNNGINSNEPTNGDYIAELETVTVGVTQLLVTFSEDVNNPNNTDPDSVTNTDNYILVADNGDGIQTTTCNVNAGGGIIGGDLTIAINSVTYTNNGGNGPFIATVNINNGTPLPVGVYRLIVCGTTSITDLLGTPLAGNGTTIGTDFIRNFSVARAVARIPDTGFPQNQVTTLPVQSTEKAYAATNMWIEIPKLGVKMSIVGVPSTVEGWDVTWLGNNAGWLEGSAFPTWNGNSAITAHVWDAYNRPGPFARLKDLKYGDQIKVHAFGQIYLYEIRESTTILPNNISTVLKHEEKSWITLITCEDYLESSKTYLSRRMVRAVLVKVTAE